DFLQAGQGFMVKSAEGGSPIYFNANMRNHGAPVYYKKSFSEKSQINLYASNPEYEALTQFYFLDNAKNGLDPGYDAGLYGGLENFKLYSQLVEDNGTDFMIQALPNSEFNSISISIGFDCTDTSFVSFRAESFSYPYEAEIILEDRELNIFTDLKSAGSGYSVNLTEKTSGTGRFYLHTFDPNTVGTDNQGKSKLTIYSVEKEIFIKGEIPENSTLYIFDLMGRAVKIFDLEADLNPSLKVPELMTGIYILRINNGIMEESQRLFLK
ncbi:MAG: T9SS type A sorting domain-containing protein, partial [Ignavibacteriales bacterium]|nr:T9SS type A sorting domain-containing protein [Ignavibacteriales bacterium]